MGVQGTKGPLAPLWSAAWSQEHSPFPWGLGDTPIPRSLGVSGRCWHGEVSPGQGCCLRKTFRQKA